jgi:hypothetical protein
MFDDEIDDVVFFPVFEEFFQLVYHTASVSNSMDKRNTKDIRLRCEFVHNDE